MSLGLVPHGRSLLVGINDAKNGEESAQNYTGGAGQCREESWDQSFPKATNQYTQDVMV